MRGRCEFGASCRFSHPLFDLAGAPAVPADERVVVGRLCDLPQWRPPGAASGTAARPASAAARPASRPGTAGVAALRPQSGRSEASARSVLQSAPPEAVAAVCDQFDMAPEELEAMLGPDGLQDALEQILQMQEAERAALQASSSAPAPPPPPPRPLSAAPAAAAASRAEQPRAPSAASQAGSSGLPAESSSSSMGGMRIASSDGAWVCHCGACNHGKRSRCKAEGCTQLAPCRSGQLAAGGRGCRAAGLHMNVQSGSAAGCIEAASLPLCSWSFACLSVPHNQSIRHISLVCPTLCPPRRKWMLGSCTAASCQYPHPPFDAPGSWAPPSDSKPKAVLWEGAPLFGAPQPAVPAPQPAAPAPQPVAAVPQPAAPAHQAPAEDDDGDLSALLQVSFSRALRWPLCASVCGFAEMQPSLSLIQQE